MKLLLALIIIAAAQAQKTTTHALKFTAGAMFCTFERREPAALSGLHLECIAATASIKEDAVIAAPGLTGSFFAAKDAISWTFQPAGVALLYKVTANGKVETGSL